MATNNKNFKVKNGLDVNGEITASAIGGDEGGQLNLEKPATNTTLSGNVSIDVYQNRLRIFDNGGTNRGAYIDLSTAATGVGSNLLAGGGGITDIVQDTTPQLGGDLDAQGYDITNLNSVTLDTTPTSPGTAAGTIYWDDGDGVPKAILNANVTIGVGQEQILKAKNATGSTITKGSVVYINGAQGQNPTIALADADTEATSSKTFGFAAEAIIDGAEGFVITEGILRGVNTNGFTEGGAIWLSSTAGAYTQTIPAEPAHAVFLGYAVKAHADAGEVIIKIQNGYELTELHGVTIDGTPADNEVLAYDTTSGLWINQTAAEAGLATSTHTHGNITNDGKVGSTSGLVLGTTTAGAVAAFTASAPSSPSTEFLRGDGTWVVPTDTNTTYSVSAETATGGANLRLTDSSATTDDVKIASGTNVTVTRTDANTITISSTDTDTNTTYAISAETVAGGANLRLTGSDTTTDDVKIASGTNVTVSRTDANTITIDATDTNTVTRLQGTGGSYVSGDVLIQGTSPISTSQSGNTITIASSAVTSVTGTSPISSSGGTTPAISIADASTTVKGAVQLSDSTSSTSTSLAATANAVKTAYDLANGKVSQTNGTVTTAASGSGVVRNIYTSTSAPSGGSDGDVWMVYV